MKSDAVQKNGPKLPYLFSGAAKGPWTIKAAGRPSCAGSGPFPRALGAIQFLPSQAESGLLKRFRRVARFPHALESGRLTREA